MISVDEEGTDGNNLPLRGLKVLDLSRVLAGPLCTMTLSDMGADILKVEGPTGDETRAWGPPWIGDVSAYFAAVNRNKKSLVLDLSAEEGKAHLAELLRVADVLVENFRPGRLDRWGLDRATISTLNPRLVHCSITGFGEAGPYHEYPGFDPVVEAMSGLMSINGPRERNEPYKVGVAVVDILAALYASTAVLALLRRRDISGEGGHVSVPLLDVALSSLVNVASSHLATGEPTRRYGNDHPNIAPFGLFSTATNPIMICVGNDKQWRALCAEVGFDQTEFKMFIDNESRVKHRQELTEQLQARFREWRADELATRLMEAGVPAGPVNTVAGALEDRHVRESGILQEVWGRDGQAFRMVGAPFVLDGVRPQVRHAPPGLNEDGEAVKQWMDSEEPYTQKSDLPSGSDFRAPSRQADGSRRGGTS